MTTAHATRPALDATHAARLERLAARRNPGARIMQGEVLSPPSAPRSAAGAAGVDAALAARLDQLATARSGNAQVPPTGRTNAPGATTGTRTSKRRHPAKHSRTAALALSVLASGGLGFLFASTDPGVSAAPAVPVGVVPAATNVSTAGATPTVPATAPTATAAATLPAATVPAAAAPAATVPATTAPAPTVPAAPITVNGQSFHNKWGDVQVQATFAADGTLTNVDAVQVPFRDGKSVRINDRVVPRLNSEALAAQSASVDTVSGATYTSVGYRQSLQSAIDIAVANGIAVPATA